MFEPKVMNKPRRRIKITKGMLAFGMVCMLLGGVSAAMLLSNQLQAGFDVYTDIPFSVAFNPDPSDSYMRIGDTATGAIDWTCAAAADFTTVILVEITAPSVSYQGFSPYFEIMIDGSPVIINGADGVFAGSYDSGTIGAGGSGSWSVSFEAVSDYPTIGSAGHWSVTFILSGDPV